MCTKKIPVPTKLNLSHAYCVPSSCNVWQDVQATQNDSGHDQAIWRIHGSDRTMAKRSRRGRGRQTAPQQQIRLHHCCCMSLLCFDFWLTDLGKLRPVTQSSRFGTYGHAHFHQKVTRGLHRRGDLFARLLLEQKLQTIIKNQKKGGIGWACRNTTATAEGFAATRALADQDGSRMVQQNLEYWDGAFRWRWREREM